MPRKRVARPPPSPLNNESETVPIFQRMRDLRGEDLTDSQIATISKFMTSKVSRKDAEEFAKGFEISVELDAAETELKKPVSKALRAALSKRIRQLKNKVTPGSRKAAIESNRPLKQEALKRIRQGGAPENIGDFIKQLADEGVLTRTYKAGGTFQRSERAVRDFLRKAFGIKGKPGRKPR